MTEETPDCNQCKGGKQKDLIRNILYENRYSHFNEGHVLASPVLGCPVCQSNALYPNGRGSGFKPRTV